MKIHRHTATGLAECELCPDKTVMRATIYAGGDYKLPFIMVVCTHCYWSDHRDMSKGVSPAVTEHLQTQQVLIFLSVYAVQQVDERDAIA